MKTLISLFLISFVAFCTISCNDDDKDTPDLANRYGAYEKPHFAFEYASDTIRIGMKPYYEKKIAVTEFKAMFNAMATEKMGAYFKGIQFKENKQLIISARMKEGDVYNHDGKSDCRYDRRYDGNRFQPDAGRHGSYDYERGKKSAGRNFDTNP